MLAISSWLCQCTSPLSLLCETYRNYKELGIKGVHNILLILPLWELDPNTPVLKADHLAIE